MKKTRVLPHTFWSASSFWAFEGRSLGTLFLSLAILGFGEGLLVVAHLGSAPWTVLSQGIALQNGFSIGWASLAVSCVVMLMWIPLKLRIGLGTLLNIVVIAFFLGITTHFITTPDHLIARFLFAVSGILLFGVGSAFYLTCHQGAGPRDGLMVGLCQYFNLKVGIVRTAIEISVCLLGFLLGGTVGIGTLLFAFGIGWVIQLTLALMFRMTHLLHKGQDFS